MYTVKKYQFRSNKNSRKYFHSQFKTKREKEMYRMKKLIMADYNCPMSNPTTSAIRAWHKYLNFMRDREMKVGTRFTKQIMNELVEKMS